MQESAGSNPDSHPRLEEQQLTEEFLQSLDSAPSANTCNSTNKVSRLPRRVDIKRYFLHHYTGTPGDILFKRFKLGAMLFFLGLVIIYGAYQLLPESILQEGITLLGVVVIGIGFLTAMLAQVRLVMGRLIHILFHK